MSAFLSAGWAERMLEMFSARDLPCSADCSTPNNRAGSQWRVETPGYKTWSTRDTTLNDKPPRWHYHIRKQQPPTTTQIKLTTLNMTTTRWQPTMAVLDDNPKLTTPRWQIQMTVSKDSHRCKIQIAFSLIIFVVQNKKCYLACQSSMERVRGQALNVESEFRKFGAVGDGQFWIRHKKRSAILGYYEPIPATINR